MIQEIATIAVKPGREADFERGAAEAEILFRSAVGCRSFRVDRSVEHPLRYVLVVGWDTVENHIVDFRGSPDFARWRDLVGETFDGSPDVHHVATAIPGFAR